MTTKLPFLSDDHDFAIANVAAQSAELDIVIDSLVYLTVKPEAASLFLVRNMGSDRLVEIIRLIFLDEMPEFRAKIDSLFERVKKSRTERNHVLHWLHEPTGSKELVRFVDKRRGREKKPKDLTARDIQDIADAIYRCYDEMLQWWNLYNWHCEVRLHGKPSQLVHPPHWAFPKELRQLSKKPQRGPRPHRPPK